MAQVWNLPTLGAGLPAVAEALYRKNASDQNLALEAQRTATLDQETAARTGIMQQQNEREQQRFGVEQADRAKKEKAQADYQDFLKLRAAPKAEQDKWADTVRQQDPRLQNASTDQILQAYGAGIMHTLGIPQPRMVPTAKGYQPETDVQGQMPYEAPQRAPLEGPTATQRDFAAYEHMTPDRRRLYDQMHAAGRAPQDESFNASDTNAIRGLVAQAFGGVYDPISGNLSGLRKEDISNLNRVAARASKIYQESGGKVPHAVAVQQAFDELTAPTSGAPAAPKNIGATLPAGVPPGSVQVGTSGGKPVYRDPSGKQWIVK